MVRSVPTRRAKVNSHITEYLGKIGLFIWFLANAISHSAFAQNFDKLGSDGAAVVSGGVTLSGIGYAQDGIAIPSRDPFTWYVTGNITATILDVSLPFTFTYSNQGGKFTQPFNRTAIHPSYKWFKSHIGLISTTFSPNTLSGHLFLGGAVDLNPGKWKISAMAGRLIKPVPYSAIDNNSSQCAYGRFGFGLQVGYSLKFIEASLTAFKAQDNPSSIPVSPLNGSIKPQDNLVMGAKLKATPLKSVTVEAEYALSALTQNRNDEGDTDGGRLSFLYPAISGNATSSVMNAFKSSVNYRLKNLTIGAGFEHIDPGYKTLGGYYFNNDLQNFTLNSAVSFWKNKCNLAFNGGFQRNNLSASKTATTSRLVGNANINIVPAKGLVFNANFSNFSNYSRNRPATNPFYYQPSDTLNFYQVTKSISAMTAYSFGKTNSLHSLTALYVYNRSISVSGGLNSITLLGGNLSGESPVPIQVHTSNLAWSIQLKPSQIAFTAAGNMNHSIVDTLTSDFFGPSANIQKGLFNKKLNLTAGATYNQQFQQGIQVGNVLNYRAAVAFNPQLKNKKAGVFTISANANLLQRMPTISNLTKIPELNVFVNVGYTF